MEDAAKFRCLDNSPHWLACSISIVKVCLLFCIPLCYRCRLVNGRLIVCWVKKDNFGEWLMVAWMRFCLVGIFWWPLFLCPKKNLVIVPYFLCPDMMINGFNPRWEWRAWAIFVWCQKLWWKFQRTFWADRYLDTLGCEFPIYFQYSKMEPSYVAFEGVRAQRLSSTCVPWSTVRLYAHVGGCHQSMFIGVCMPTVSKPIFGWMITRQEINPRILVQTGWITFDWQVDSSCVSAGWWI